MAVGQIGWGTMDRIDLARVEGSCKHGNKPSDSDILEYLSDWCAEGLSSMELVS
jgi:hypothetical protein